jgi:L-aminopeptidase/D-esterase-like protein
MSDATVLGAGKQNAITDVAGIRVGHWTDRRGGTGCTVVLCEGAQVAAVDVRGGAPGTRETDVLGGANLVRVCHAVVFCGGSVFGLDAATGVTRYLSEREVGFATTARTVPIVSAAVLFDLGVGKATAAPNAEAGYRAARRAGGGKVERGTTGAGTGATVGKILGADSAMKGGVGTASVVGPRGLVVGALVVTNAVGAIMDASTGEVVAAPRADQAGALVPLGEALERRTAEMDALVENTTLVCVATNGVVEHATAQRMAFQAHNGLARTILPVHTTGDGDVAFAIGMGQVETKPHDALALGAMTTLAVERAVLDSIHSATGLHGVPSAAEWMGEQRG